MRDPWKREGQEVLPGTLFAPSELWCARCGGPVTFKSERFLMECQACTAGVKKRLREESRARVRLPTGP